jgi:hypothetical protein
VRPKYRTGTPLPSKHPFYIFFQQIYVLNFLNMLYTLCWGVCNIRIKYKIKYFKNCTGLLKLVVVDCILTKVYTMLVTLYLIWNCNQSVFDESITWVKILVACIMAYSHVKLLIGAEPLCTSLIVELVIKTLNDLHGHVGTAQSVKHLC